MTRQEVIAHLRMACACMDVINVELRAILARGARTGYIDNDTQGGISSGTGGG